MSPTKSKSKSGDTSMQEGIFDVSFTNKNAKILQTIDHSIKS